MTPITTFPAGTLPFGTLAVGILALAVAAAVALGGDRLYARLGYHEHYPDRRRPIRIRLVGFGSLCGIATGVAVGVGLWLPLALLAGVSAVAVRREVAPRPAFVPIHELEPSVGPETDATVVEDGLVLSALLREWHVWAPLSLLAGVVETGVYATLGWFASNPLAFPLSPEQAALTAVALGVAYPLALAARRPWRDTSFGEGSWYFAVGFWVFAWGGTAVTIGATGFLLARFGLVVPLAALLALLAFAHLPPDEGDAPMELVLLYWPVGLAGVGALTLVEWTARFGFPV